MLSPRASVWDPRPDSTLLTSAIRFLLLPGPHTQFRIGSDAPGLIVGRSRSDTLTRVTDHPVDLRSDTVTRPTKAMRRAIADAEVGDDHYGEDPTVRMLEEEAAAMLGHQAALFVPTGTMGNNIALRLLAEPGTEVLADNDSHVVSYEMGSLAAIGGIQTRTLINDGGVLRPSAVAAQLRVDPLERSGKGSNYAMVTTRAVAIENTHVRSGGRPWRLPEIDALVDITGPVGVGLHCDGARIWNASVATGIALDEYGKRFSTLSVCLSKGLGAPVGSLVVSNADNIDRARLLRRQLGAAMRQVGIIAAGGLYAIRHHIDRLADDHRRAKELAAALAEAAPGCVDPTSVETNIVLFEVADANDFVARARDARRAPRCHHPHRCSGRDPSRCRRPPAGAGHRHARPSPGPVAIASPRARTFGVVTARRVLSEPPFQSRPMAMGSARGRLHTPRPGLAWPRSSCLMAGGNAADAAVTAAAVATVVQPFTSSIGGVGWATVYERSTAVPRCSISTGSCRPPSTRACSGPIEPDSSTGGGWKESRVTARQPRTWRGRRLGGAPAPGKGLGRSSRALEPAIEAAVAEVSRL